MNLKHPDLLGTCKNRTPEHLAGLPLQELSPALHSTIRLEKKKKKKILLRCYGHKITKRKYKLTRITRR